MSTLSPALIDAFALLSDNLYLHLDEVDSLATHDDEWSTENMETARVLICDLVRVIRELLLEHKLRNSGDCHICTSAWPCPVVTTIHAMVKDPKRQFVPLVLRARNLD
ncbi:MAG: hypothetical protein ACRDTF_01175 [Pseudonocardiaceae bacterium]